MEDHQVFISYAWGGESEVVANEIEAELSAKSIQLVRDKADLGFKGLIREFMEKIGQGNLVVLIISDKYLKSKNCMFELLEVEKKGEFHSRVFPVILPDADIYDSVGIVNYLKYWDQKIKELNARVKELDNLADTRKVQEDINLYTDIRGAIDSLAAQLSNMNTLTLDFMRASRYQPLTDLLQQHSEPRPSQGLTPSLSSKKQGKVLYHIPDMMQVEKWTRCTVRLAWEEILLTAGLSIAEEERVIESIRLGNVMQVSIEEGRQGQNFVIQALNNTEQFIFEDDFTEWLFDVKAKSEGTFILILRVTLIQIIEGFERKKDIVLERNVKTEAVVPDALPKFETAEDGLSAPIIDRKSKGSVNLDEMDRKETNPEIKYSKVYRELAEDYDQPTVPPIISNRHSSPSMGTPPSAYGPPKLKSTRFRKILPYAASVAIIAAVGILFFSEMGNESLSPQDDYYTSSPSPSISEGSLEGENGYQSEKLLLAMSLDGTSPTGEQFTEVMLFMIQAEQLDSLTLLNPGSYTVEVFPASDTVNLNVGLIRDFTIMEIQDSVLKSSVRPAEVGSQLIDKRQLQINPRTQLLITRPQHLDSITSKKLKIGSKILREN